MMSAHLNAVECQLSKSMKRQQKRSISFITFVNKGIFAEYAKLRMSLCIRSDIIGCRLYVRMKVIEKACKNVTSWYNCNEFLKIGPVRLLLLLHQSKQLHKKNLHNEESSAMIFHFKTAEEVSCII